MKGMRTRLKAAYERPPELFDQPLATAHLLPGIPGPRAIEDAAFPFEELSHVAELESWRKEINRPLSHIHKWWAQRLGTVFRAIVIGALAPKGTDVLSLFYQPVRASEAIVFDPFMGSGTTLTEAVKVGARAIGRDVNPVAFFLVKNALAIHDRDAIVRTFRAIERDVAAELTSLYQARLPDGRSAHVLYYFWVKTVDCPECATSVDLFGSRIFAQHAYAKRYPEAQASCPHCGAINAVRFDSTDVVCGDCRRGFNASRGPARGQKATCPSCSHEFGIATTVRDNGKPPAHRMYAKLVLLPDGSKKYMAIDNFDRELYATAEARLAKLKNAFPIEAIAPGHNTNQALGYNYRAWHQFFNARQLLALSLLGQRIRKINEPTLRDLFTCLFSGALEFNNMFASYKGEGTGAVRHMFYHHILKPERVPLEANLWGTPKSSGSFSTMFEGRIRRALDYAQNPFELRAAATSGVKSSEKVFDLSEPIGFELAESMREFEEGRRVYLSCGDSGRTDIVSASVDVVVTDPPFFDNVHYSELADFFHVWQRHILGHEGALASPSTRSESEVQDSDADNFTERLGAVWTECHRVLKDEGLLVFTYHHSRNEGWRSILLALMKADFAVVAAHPIKAEMSGATPKHQAKEPIDLDIILVCRKRTKLSVSASNKDLWSETKTAAAAQVSRLRQSGRALSRNDIRIIVMGQALCRTSLAKSMKAALALLDDEEDQVESIIAALANTSHNKKL